MNPVGLLTKNIISELGLTREELSVELGYKNLEKGMSKIKKFLNAEIVDNKFLDELNEVIPFPEGELKLAVKLASYFDDIQQENSDLLFKTDFLSRHVTEILKFKPCLLRVTERQVHRYGLGLLLTNPKHSIIPDQSFLILSLEEQREIIPKLIADDLELHGSRVERWGAITGYEFFREPLLYDEYSNEAGLLSEDNYLSQELFLGEDW
ncbi:MAG: hypothetical protein AMXMBFR48_14670 [Ignavibacteriales bacterium]